MANYGTCKYCGKEKELCKAHIVPKKFYLDYTTERYRSIDQDFNKEYAQSGIWDDTILCGDCDNKLNEYDKEGYKILLNALKTKEKTINDIPKAYLFKEGEDFDYINLRFFFISLLWRASISSKAMYNKVNLGKFEDIALSILKNEKTDDEKYFQTIVFREPEEAPYGKVHYCIKSKFDNVICYKIFFTKFIVCIIPNTKHCRASKGLEYLKLAFNKNEFVIIEDGNSFEDKRKFLNKVKKNWKQKDKICKQR